MSEEKIGELIIIGPPFQADLDQVDACGDLIPEILPEFRRKDEKGAVLETAKKLLEVLEELSEL